MTNVITIASGPCPWCGEQCSGDTPTVRLSAGILSREDYLWHTKCRGEYVAVELFMRLRREYAAKLTF